MKSKYIIITFIFIFFYNSAYAKKNDCNQFEKLSAKYIECNANKLKTKTIEKVEVGKEKIENSGIKDKLNKFKDSKTLKDLIKK